MHGNEVINRMTILSEKKYHSHHKKVEWQDTRSGRGRNQQNWPSDLSWMTNIPTFGLPGPPARKLGIPVGLRGVPVGVAAPPPTRALELPNPVGLVDTLKFAGLRVQGHIGTIL
jgi:hypothetical protein